MNLESLFAKRSKFHAAEQRAALAAAQVEAEAVHLVAARAGGAGHRRGAHVEAAHDARAAGRADDVDARRRHVAGRGRGA